MRGVWSRHSRPRRPNGVHLVHDSHALDTDAGGDDADRDQNGCLGEKTRSAGDHRRRAARPAAEERREGRRQRHTGEALERRALSPLSAGKASAFSTLAKMGTKRALRLTRQRPVHLPGDRELCLLATELALELLAKCPPRAKDQSLDRGDGHAQFCGDVRIRPALELPHDKGCALVERELREGALQLLRCRTALGVVQLDAVALSQLDLGRTAHRQPVALPAHVVGNRDQPVVRRAGSLALPERAVGVQKRGLGDVFRV